MTELTGLFSGYPQREDTLDEVFSDFPKAYKGYGPIREKFAGMSLEAFSKLNESARLSFLNQGITYAVYSEEGGGTEQVFPFDLFPRIISAEEWADLEKGLIQRNLALNKFLADVYGEGDILKEGIVPRELVESSVHFVPEMKGFLPAGGIYTHISGTDLVRHTDGEFYVLEDNLRSPSGVSYVLSNRQAMRRTLYDLFNHARVEAVSGYPDMLLETLQSVSPLKEQARCCILTPGQYNSAYYEHSLLAQRMGIDLVQGTDLYVENDLVFVNTLRGRQPIHVIYRRIDDAFLDPEVFRKDSMLGVPGLMRAYLKGNVAIVNAPGTGIADDKAICAYVPDMIRFYGLGEPLLQNVKTYLCGRPEDLAYVLEHLSELVIKPVDMSGGYGVLIGDRLSEAELADAAAALRANPRNFIAQPKIMLSTHGTYIDGEAAFRPRHIDLRTFTLLGDGTTQVLRGGLTRVALKEGSLIVNSSQGGGSKDTWVVGAAKEAGQPAPGLAGQMAPEFTGSFGQRQEQSATPMTQLQEQSSTSIT